MNNTINRLIIIGNGFDLAHGMKTRYKDFVTWYVKQRIKKTVKDKDDKLIPFVPVLATSYKYNNKLTLKQNLDEINRMCKVQLGHFFEEIIKEIENKNWVDIEYEYYKYLCGLMKKLDLSDEEDTKKEVSKEIDGLNEEMKFITKKLKEYLKGKDGRVDENCIRVNNEILDKMMMPLSEQEIAVEALELWDSFVKENSHKKLQPDKIWILNFNYTSLIQRYYEEITKKPRYNQKEMRSYLNYIHGSLYGKEEIIFGYGDDSGEMYKRLSDKNDNRLLENDKTVKYLGSFWYRNFFGFIESAPFQVYIMGHSCGISDRTLLSTIFQHENCVSIKPYFYENGDNDDYYEIIKNISRCFDDKKLMRDRVVNKEFCEPLPQIPEEEKE